MVTVNTRGWICDRFRPFYASDISCAHYPAIPASWWRSLAMIFISFPCMEDCSTQNHGCRLELWMQARTCTGCSYCSTVNLKSYVVWSCFCSLCRLCRHRRRWSWPACPKARHSRAEADDRPSVTSLAPPESSPGIYSWLLEFMAYVVLAASATQPGIDLDCFLECYATTSLGVYPKPYLESVFAVA